MDLRSHYPYSLLRKGIIRSYPSLQENAKTDIVIIGAGITGALIGYELAGAGFEVIIVDKRHVGIGSTAASTGLLQYEIDVPLHKLAEQYGFDKAARCYQLCRDAIFQIGDICKTFKDFREFKRRPSFQFASSKKDLTSIQLEYDARIRAGFRLDLLDQKEIRDLYGFDSVAGLLSYDGAEIDAYTLTHQLLQKITDAGMKVYDKTEIVSINRGKKIQLKTKEGFKITANQIVIACGYESQKYLPLKVESVHSTYAIASEQMQQQEFWHLNSLIWETSRPYIYLRTTADNRIIIGGKDIKSANPVIRDKMIRQKRKTLELTFQKMFPEIIFKTDFSWAGIFADTKDGLPYIGKINQLPRTWFALGFGGNGITFSMIAANLIRNALRDHVDSDIQLFDFKR